MYQFWQLPGITRKLSQNNPCQAHKLPKSKFTILWVIFVCLLNCKRKEFNKILVFAFHRVRQVSQGSLLPIYRKGKETTQRQRDLLKVTQLKVTAKTEERSPDSSSKALITT